MSELNRTVDSSDVRQRTALPSPKAPPAVADFFAESRLFRASPTKFVPEPNSSPISPSPLLLDSNEHHRLGLVESSQAFAEAPAELLAGLGSGLDVRPKLDCPAQGVEKVRQILSAKLDDAEPSSTVVATRTSSVFWPTSRTNVSRSGRNVQMFALPKSRDLSGGSGLNHQSTLMKKPSPKARSVNSRAGLDARIMALLSIATQRTVPSALLSPGF